MSRGFRVFYACGAVINLCAMVNAANSGNWPLFGAALFMGASAMAKAFSGIGQE